jgi:hypothetical protein
MTIALFNGACNAPGLPATETALSGGDPVICPAKLHGGVYGGRWTGGIKNAGLCLEVRHIWWLPVKISAIIVTIATPTAQIHARGLLLDLERWQPGAGLGGSSPGRQ